MYKPMLIRKASFLFGLYFRIRKKKTLLVT